MKKESLKNWFVRVFAKDIDLPKNSFIYLFFSLVAIFLVIEAFLYKYALQTEMASVINIEIIVLIIILTISFLTSVILVDKVKKRTRHFNLALLFCILGIFFSAFSEVILLYYMGLLIVIVTAPQLIVLWLTILVHETNILNRGRIIAFFLSSCSLLGCFSFIFVYFEFLYKYFFILVSILLVIIIWCSRKYKYIETEERLKSDKKFFKIIFEKQFFRYTSSFIILSFILGDLFARYNFDVDYFIFFLASSIYLIVAGCFLDNIGRKTSIVLGILVLSFFLISYGSFIDKSIIFGMPRRVFLSIHYGFSLLPLILAIQTISGDFSTERGNLKYRGRINGIFLASMFSGIIIGYTFSKWIDGLYKLYPELNNFIPIFPNLLNGFILVILLVWMMAMKEFLISKEKNWPAAMINLYVFSVNGVGLYYHNFEKNLKGEEKEKKRELDEDLISGALTGVVAIISEITQSKKQLRKIDKEGYHLLFSFGKYHVTCLISKIDLPVLLKKLDEFSKDFGIKFGKNLKNFVGNVAPFNSTKYLVNKYFSQKYAFLFK